MTKTVKDLHILGALRKLKLLMNVTLDDNFENDSEDWRLFSKVLYTGLRRHGLLAFSGHNDNKNTNANDN